MLHVIGRQKEFSTPWFDVISKTLSEGDPRFPYYLLEMPDYVSVVALTEGQEVLLVRQYRPTVENHTLELPSGHVEEGESPAEAAQRELLEETGYEGDDLELLGCLAPDTGRLGNRMWCYFASQVKLHSPTPPLEAGIELVVCSQRELMSYIAESKFNHALHLAAVFLATMRHKLPQGDVSDGE